MSRIREAIDSLTDKAIIFLMGEEDLNPSGSLFTKEELREFYGVKEDVERTTGLVIEDKFKN